jgi:hypothetical protein
MEIFKIIVAVMLALSALGNTYFWIKAETGTIEELSFMVKSFGFSILLVLI